MVTCRDPKEEKSSWASRGMVMGQSACSGGDEPDSSAHKMEKPGVLVVFILAQWRSSSGGAASSGPGAVGSLGLDTPTGGSTLGITNGAASLEVGPWSPS